MKKPALAGFFSNPPGAQSPGGGIMALQLSPCQLDNDLDF
jgi:hypothetical protein